MLICWIEQCGMEVSGKVWWVRKDSGRVRVEFINAEVSSTSSPPWSPDVSIPWSPNTMSNVEASIRSTFEDFVHLL